MEHWVAVRYPSRVLRVYGASECAGSTIAGSLLPEAAQIDPIP
jgi:hypothetical protein